jgi:hypothetical protein
MSRQNPVSEYGRQFLPSIDLRGATWQAYLNVLNAFQGMDMISGSDPTMALKSVTRTPQERFVYHLGLLDAYLKDEKDEDFRKEGIDNLPDLYDANPPNEAGRFEKFSDYLRYWVRVQSLMKRNGWFSLGREPIHL